jgi:S-adenosylmethionine:tRNA ribosyltransferase-isomerase
VPLSIDAFDYDLPREAIAQRPLPERDASRLLVLERRSGDLGHRAFRDLPELLDAGDLLVVNRSAVFPARLLGLRAGGGAAEVLLLRPVDGPVWEAFVRPARRLKPGDRVRVAAGFAVRVETRATAADGRRRVALEVAQGDAKAAIERHGRPPLPPYIERPADADDRARYQTVYARESGSVAAPTAGLHFTDRLLEALARRGVERAEIVLHVGPATFQPVKVRDVAQHTVAAEPFVVPEETAAAVARARERKRRVVAVGTTSVRALESSALVGGLVRPGAGATDLVVVPGFRFQVVDALVTNFHLPRSSLLLLVSAFAGRERVLAAYAEALRRGYRFYSYGDAMLLL